MVLRTKIVGAALLLSVSGPASAQDFFTADMLLRDAGSEVHLLYVNTVGETLGWANAVLSAQSQDPLYCQPPRLTITDEQYMQILRSHVSAWPAMGAEPAPLVVLDALRDTFPC